MYQMVEGDCGQGKRLSIVIVTHEMGFARDVADRVLLFADGVIAEEGTPKEIFDNPQNKRTQDFLAAVL